MIKKLKGEYHFEKGECGLKANSFREKILFSTRPKGALVPEGPSVERTSDNLTSVLSAAGTRRRSRGSRQA
jgi:hypothetical protein